MSKQPMMTCYREKEILTLYQAIREDKNSELLLDLVRQGKLKPETRNREGVNALLLAVDEEFPSDVLQSLLDQGFHVDSADEEGRTPLHYSVDLSNNEIMQFLMSRGADPHFKDKSGSAPIEEVEPTDEAYAILAGETL